ncbi:nickel pincer cofactor biosynthesis protein LarB [Consotaella salsifontis]|nr:nickel pincer cofactor biosynthesis protein LarB [Consotaella salsifontis]
MNNWAIRHDDDRPRRIGIAEAVLCSGKTTEQAVAAAEAAFAAHGRCLMTRLSPEAFAALPEAFSSRLDYDPLSRTAVLGAWPEIHDQGSVAVATAGTADVAVALEAVRTLRFEGVASDLVTDVGVAGLWRLLSVRDRLADYPVVILVAGMEGALFSVAGGLLPGLLIAVPTSVGYGVTAAGKAALTSALGSCAPGVLTTNIDNGYGAACAALRALNAAAAIARLKSPETE